MQSQLQEEILIYKTNPLQTADPGETLYNSRVSRARSQATTKTPQAQPT
jgi:hypothetical protein